VKDHKKRIVFVVLFLLTTVGKAQDIHFSSINANPMFINPASTAMMNSTFRISTIYRNQWSSVSDGYNTFLTSFEIQPYVSNDNSKGLGLGVMFMSDVAGSLSYGEKDLSISASYFLALDREKNYYLSFGVQASRKNWGYSLANADFSQDISNNEAILLDDLNTYDISLGSMWQYSKDDNHLLQINVAAFHLNEPSLSFFDDKTLVLHRRYLASISYLFPYNDLYSIRPQILFQKQYNNNELVVGGDFIFNLSDAIFTTQNFSLGLFYRNSDAIIICPKYRYNNFLAGMSYDINLSKLNKVSHTYGGVELWLSYAFSPVNNKRINTKIPCPIF
jgi:type IX secretion system PorP/SprF family membrane protein